MYKWNLQAEILGLTNETNDQVKWCEFKKNRKNKAHRFYPNVLREAKAVI